MRPFDLALAASMLFFGLCGMPISSNPSNQMSGLFGKSQEVRRLSKHGKVEMLWVPEGWFWMGSQAEAPSNPRHRVHLSGFWISKNVITVAQFKAYCADRHAEFPKYMGPKENWGEDHPVTAMTWKQARDFCAWAGGDLPTEAQWEKAARGTDERTYPWGNKFDRTRLWGSKEKYGDSLTTAPVGSYPSGASPYGCLDMAGNVSQWCLDYWSDTISTLSDHDPKGPGASLFRVTRGGSWFDYTPKQFASTSRVGSGPASTGNGVGIRLVCRE